MTVFSRTLKEARDSGCFIPNEIDGKESTGYVKSKVPNYPNRALALAREASISTLAQTLHGFHSN